MYVYRRMLALCTQRADYTAGVGRPGQDGIVAREYSTRFIILYYL